MVKKFSVNCDFGGSSSPVTFYIGKPEGDHHPIYFQADWLSKERGGTVPPQIMQSLQSLKEIAKKHGISFEELCEYALQSNQIESGQLPEEAIEAPAAGDGLEDEARLSEPKAAKKRTKSAKAEKEEAE